MAGSKLSNRKSLNVNLIETSLDETHIVNLKDSRAYYTTSYNVNECYY